MSLTHFLWTMIALVAYTANAATYDASVCTSGWRLVNTRCMYYSGDATGYKWSDGDEICKSRGARLASIHSDAENDMAYELCKDNNFGYWRLPRGVCWLGLYQVQGQTGTNYQWLSGFPLTRTFWAPGEPNNVGGNGEDCVHNWDRKNSQKKWNDEPCTNSYPFLCTNSAWCPAGRYLSQAYLPRGTESNRQDPLKNLCTDCPVGTYLTAQAQVGREACVDCPAGYMGDVIGQTYVCDTSCPAGYFCPAGTSSLAAVGATNGKKACPKGKYGGAEGYKDENECEYCAAGYFCTGVGETSSTPSGQSCQAGKCGFEGQSTSACNQNCPAGYRCPLGSACPDAVNAVNFALECGSNAQYCPAGTKAVAKTVPAGHYSTGGTSTTRTGYQVCEPGYYCELGVRKSCPGGSYNPEQGSSSEQACLDCDAGYYCLPSSTSSQQINCGENNPSDPENVYCPKGSSGPLPVPANYYSTPTSTSYKFNRQNIQACTSKYVCAFGIRTAVLSWNGVCSGNNDAVLVNEMSAIDSLVKAFPAQSLIGSHVITFSIEDFAFYDPSITTCTPDSSSRNQDQFKIDSSGNLQIKHDKTLNYEVCLPVLDIAYDLKIKATAATSGGTYVSDISCVVRVTIDDRNDVPVYIDYNSIDGALNKVYHRAIYEKSDKNVPVRVCGSESTSVGCLSAVNDVAQVMATDEDDGTFLR